MPDLTTDDLPDPVRAYLPPHAQEIYLAAFNNAWRKHAGDLDGGRLCTTSPGRRSSGAIGRLATSRCRSSHLAEWPGHCGGDAQSAVGDVSDAEATSQFRLMT